MGAKLVRGRVQDLPWRAESEKQYVRKVVDPAEHIRLLRQKILEEVGEMFAAPSPENAAHEAADVLEAIAAYLTLIGLKDNNQVNLLREAKFEARGGFFEGIVYEGQD